jgi:hypothetical protein
MGRPEEALSLLGQCKSICDAYNLRGVTVAPRHNALAEAHLMPAEECSLAPGTSAVDRARQLSKTLHSCKKALRKGRMFPLVLPEALKLTGTCYWLRGRPAAARKYWQRGLSMARALGQRGVAEAIVQEMTSRR